MSPSDARQKVTALLMEELGEMEKAREGWREAERLYQRAGVGAGVEECRTALGRLEP